MEEKKLGIIDLGSNSIRFVMYEIESSGSYKETLNLKKTARLGVYVDKDKNITSQGVQLIIDILSYFKELAKFHAIDDMLCIATAVVREAPNYAEILQQIKEMTNFSFQVLSGRKEAFYGYLAVVNSTSFTEGVTIDIGGGSTEVTLFSERKVRHVHSFPFGAITLTKQFIQGERPTRTELRQLSQYLYDQFSSLSWLENQSYPVIGIGGSARNLSFIHQRAAKYPLASIHQYEIRVEDIQKINKHLAALSLQERKKVDGLSKDRADIIIPAIEAIYQLTKVVQAPLFVMSSKGLRDGLFYRKILKERDLELFPNVLEESLFQMQHHYSMKKAHAQQIAKICTQLFEGINNREVYPLNVLDLKLLQYSAQLNYLGERMGIREKSEHTFYILVTQLVDGVSHRDRIQIALISSFKSRDCLRSFLKSYKGWFSEQYIKKLELLGALVKIAYGLERTKRCLVQKVYCQSINKNSVTYRVIHHGDNRFEREYVNDNKKHLEKIIKKNVFFEYEQVK